MPANKRFDFNDFPFGKEFSKEFKNEFKKIPSKNPVLSTCPVCHHELTVTHLVCEQCHTGIDGAFTLSKFNYLDTEKLYFIEVFVKNRGNIKAIEKEMNLSYPTIKKMLDDVIVGLGYSPDSSEETPVTPSEPQKPKTSKADILDQLENGTISVAEAIEKMNQ